LGEDAIEDIHEFSMLQRFRQDRDLHAFDRAKPTLIEQSDASDESEDEDDCENIDVKNVEVS